MGRYVHRPIPAASDDQKIVLAGRHVHRPDVLSHDLYGSWEYWWIFMVRNPSEINHPIFDMTAGREIMAPTADRLTRLLGTGDFTS
jgi:hypothetical protein